MTLYRAGVALLIALIIGACIHMVVYYPQLPEVVSSHFDMNGKVNGSMSRNSFVELYAGLVVFLSALFLGLGLLLPRLPDSSINMPNKDIWLAKDRRDTTMNTVATFLVWLGAFTMLFIMATMQVTILYQLGQVTQVNSLFYPMVIVFFFITLTGTTLFLRKFRRPA